MTYVGIDMCVTENQMHDSVLSDGVMMKQYLWLFLSLRPEHKQGTYMLHNPFQQICGSLRDVYLASVSKDCRHIGSGTHHPYI